MDIKQDPNAIPNFNAGGRIGELQPNEPEQEQSSVQLDETADGDGAATGVPPTVPDQAAPGAPAVDPSKTGAGAIDGLVGAP